MQDAQYYTQLAAALVRGRLPDVPEISDAELVEFGRKAGLKLHKFKITSLRRVTLVLGILQGLQPASLLDIGAGRGAFLWPLLDQFPKLPVTVFDVLEQRINDINAVRAGGYHNLNAFHEDITAPAHDWGAFDIVTVLEVLEHLENPLDAARQCVRLADRFVVATVPSKPDNNPEHIQLFSGQTLERLFLDAGAAKVSVQYVPNHIVAVVTA